MVNDDELPILVVGGGPVGLTTALGLSFYGLRFELLEEDEMLSTDTKAGGTLTRSIEIFRRYGVADEVLQKALRIDEIGDIDRATNQRRLSVETYILKQETRYPFVLNMPQHHLEPILERAIKRSPHGSISMGQRVVGLRQLADRVILEVETANGRRSVEGRYVLACDGGRSTVRRLLNIADRRQHARAPLSADRRQGRPRYRQPARLSLSRLFLRSHRMDDPGPPAALLALSLSGREGRAGADHRRSAQEGCAFRRRDQRAHGARQEPLHRAPSHRAGMAARPRVPDGRCRASHHADVAARHEHRRARCQQSPWRLAWVLRGWADRFAARRLCVGAAPDRRATAPGRWRRTHGNTWPRRSRPSMR